MLFLKVDKLNTDSLECRSSLVYDWQKVYDLVRKLLRGKCAVSPVIEQPSQLHSLLADCAIPHPITSMYKKYKVTV